MKIEITFGLRSLAALRFLVRPPLWVVVAVGLFDVAGLAYGVARALS